MTQSSQSIDKILEENGIHPEISYHPPVLTCEQADLYTTEPQYGLKTLLLKSKKNGLFCAILNGDGRLDMKLMQELMGDKRISFVPSEDASQIIGCDPGAIPPFGHMGDIAIFVSKIIDTFPAVYFNPGINTCTYKMSGSDFQKVMGLLKVAKF